MDNVGVFVPWGMKGIAQSMGWAPGSRVLSEWWPSNERGKMYGCHVSVAGMASVLSYVTSIRMGNRVLFAIDVSHREMSRFTASTRGVGIAINGGLVC